MSQPLVSVVVPFRNTAPYLAECIESVLAQTYPHCEYIFSDNCSTDGSGEIAETYARRDPRIHLIRQPQLLPQGDHYNNVLTHISPDSKYCKIVQADDRIFPECAERMVALFEQSDSIGLVSSYYQKGDVVLGSNFPHDKPVMPGREVGRLFLGGGMSIFGSETTVMYRASLVRESQPFYDGTLLHMDTEKCLQILEKWDFGFVHQVLSFLRMDNVNESISANVRGRQPGALDWYITVQRFAQSFLEENVARTLKKKTKQEYYEMLAFEALRFREAAFWQYHRKGLKTLVETLDRPYLALQIARVLLWMVVNPGATIVRLLHLGERKMSSQSASARSNA